MGNKQSKLATIVKKALVMKPDKLLCYIFLFAEFGMYWSN